MSESVEEPSIEQLTVWRNLLDAFGQLDAAWSVAAHARQQPDALHMPDYTVTALTNAGHRGARALHGLAQLLVDHYGSEVFEPAVQACETAEQQWESAYRTLGD
jgi:hypothetical protein